MYQSYTQTQSTYSKKTSYLLLLAVLTVLLISVCELSYSNYRAGSMLRAFRMSENKQLMQGQMGKIVKAVKRIDNIMYEFKEYLDKEQYLLAKLRDIHIQDSKEESEIPQISNFVEKLNMFKQIFNEKQEQFATFTRNVKNIKTTQKNNIQNIAYDQQFKLKSEALLANMSEFQVKLKEVVVINIKWCQRTEKQLNKDNEADETQKIENYIQDLPEYYSLPPLAQRILKPQPIQLLKTLYKSTSELHQESQLQMRQKFYKERHYLAKNHKVLRSLSLSKYNIQSGIQRRNWESDILNNYNEMNEKYSLQSVVSETGFCIVVPTYNNMKNFRAELNLNSIFSQNYTNYKVVIIDDASKDKTPVLIQKYLDYFSIPKQKCELIVNKQNKKALQNIYDAIMNRCDAHQIVAIVDGDDQLIGFNVLKVLNAVYSRQKLGVVYSNFYFYQHNAMLIKEGFSKQYTQWEKEKYRATAQKFSHLITFKAELLREVNIQDLQYTNGKFYHVAYDFAMMYPLMELSCGHVFFLDQFLYLYSIGTGLNDYEVLTKDQKKLGSAILKKQRYPCSYKYDY